MVYYWPPPELRAVLISGIGSAVFKALAEGAFNVEEANVKETLENTWCNVLEACWNCDDEPEGQTPSPKQS